MQAAVRPRYAAGVALVGASLVATATVAPIPDIHLPEVHLPAIHMADVNLAAVVNPLEVYAKVFQDAMANAGALASNGSLGQFLQQVLADEGNRAGALGGALGVAGGGIANALNTQVPPLLQAAVNQLVAGNVSGAVNSLLEVPVEAALPATGLLPALTAFLTQPLQNMVNAINTFNVDPLTASLLVSGFIAPLISTPAAAAVAVQNVINAAGAGDPLGVLSAIATAPATIADGFLNGGYGPDLGPLTGLSGISVFAGGLLSASNELSITPEGTIVVKTGGPIAALQQILANIAKAIAPAAPAAPAPPVTTEVASLPKAAATTVNLTTGSTAASVPAKAAPATDTATGTDTAKPSTQTPDATDGAVADTPKGSTGATTDASDATTGKTESDSTTKDSTTKSDSGDASDSTMKSGSDVKSGTDVKTGNKSEPQNSSGSASSTGKPGGSTGSTAGHESSSEQAGASKPSSTGTSGAGAEKGENHASKASASKGKK